MTDKKDEALKLALQALEYISSHYMSLPKIGCMALAVVEEALAQPDGCQCPACKVTPHASDCAVHNEPAYPKNACDCGAQPEQEQGDSNCQNDDGCPTEMAVLQRFWRGEPIPTEHYPAWFKPAQHQEAVTVLPDGSAFAVMSYPLPKDHWLYADRQYNDGEYEPVELGKPVLTHELRNAVVSAVRYAIRGATNCGKDVDFDPDALVQNAVYALCGPFTSPPARKPEDK